jgi:hypothetical protein
MIGAGEGPSGEVPYRHYVFFLSRLTKPIHIFHSFSSQKPAQNLILLPTSFQ